MPHVIVKLWPGRSEEQKLQLADKIVKAVTETMQVQRKSVSVAIEEIAPENWDQAVYQPDIVDKKDTLIRKPGYTPPK